MDKKLALVLPLAAVVIVSGCTDMSSIPFIGSLFGPATVKYTNDIVIIRSLEATPATVFPGQTVRLTAYVQNQGSKPKDVYVDLYDFCEGTFHLDGSVKCGETTNSQASGTSGDSSSGCSVKLQPYETRDVTWTLVADKCIMLDTTCPADGLKVSVNYEQETEGLTTITLIRYEEMQRQMSEGTYTETQPTRTAGEGPIKGYINIEDKHPVAVSDTNPSTVISFQLENEGNGFLAFKPGYKPAQNERPKVHLDGINMAGIGTIDTTGASNTDTGGNCKTLDSGGPIELIKSESPKIVCTVNDLKHDFDKQMSKTLTFKISYNYEFRASTKVTVKPKALSSAPTECSSGAGSSGTGAPISISTGEPGYNNPNQPTYA
jgi:hypothetical protein